MKSRGLEDCHTATGVVILIDVLRAFSTAAYAFSRGAKEILLVSTVEEALLLKSRIPNTKVMGEVGGLLSDLEYWTQIDKFDFAMPITREDGKLIMRPIEPNS